MNDCAARANSKTKNSNDVSLLQLSGPIDRLRNTGELLPWEYGRDIGPDEYQQILGELFKQTNGWEAERYEVITQRLKNLLMSAKSL